MPYGGRIKFPGRKETEEGRSAAKASKKGHVKVTIRGAHTQGFLRKVCNSGVETTFVGGSTQGFTV